jgi:hypothetical protein
MRLRRPIDREPRQQCLTHRNDGPEFLVLPAARRIEIEQVVHLVELRPAQIQNRSRTRERVGGDDQVGKHVP